MMITAFTWTFWTTLALMVFAYVGYPVVIWALARLRPAPGDVLRSGEEPHVTLILPAHNERANIVAKLRNLFALDYPTDRLDIVCVSDGSTDGTADLVRQHGRGRVRLIELSGRGGKAAALNAGLEHATAPIVVFSDASIMLEPDSLRRLVAPFADPRVGCVSGEDRIAGSGGEALYGRYELFLRRQESRLASIVGASGCFYAQRRSLCAPFVPGLAPDFLSVLRTVEQGYRALSEPGATGAMTAVTQAGDEFQRKVRTLLRGMTTLATYRHLLNPLRSPAYSFELFAHKLLRWLVPALMAVALVANIVLALEGPFYRGLLSLQVAFYGLAAVGLAGWRPVAGTLPAKAAVYLVISNAAAAVAWVKFLTGVRQELWNPSQRAHSSGASSS
ncbi:MAG: glycosyltransferase family 2 protein [Vicinamibacterales bacterium]